MTWYLALHTASPGPIGDATVISTHLTEQAAEAACLRAQPARPALLPTRVVESDRIYRSGTVVTLADLLAPWRDEGGCHDTTR